MLVHGSHGSHSPAGDALKAAMTEGYARAFLVASVVVLAGGLLGLVIPRPRTPSIAWSGTGTAQESLPVLVD